MALTHTSNILNILEKGGFSRQQAQTLVDAIIEAHRDADLVTNKGLDVRLTEMELRMTNTLMGDSRFPDVDTEIVNGSISIDSDVPPEFIPEPSTIAVWLVLAMAGTCLIGWRRRQVA